MLLIVLLGTAEFGRMLSQYNTLAKSVRDATRYVAAKAAVGTTRVVNISAQVRAETENLVVRGTTNQSASPLLQGLDVGAVTVSDAGNGYVSVSATYAYIPMLGGILPGFGVSNPIPLTRSWQVTVIMRAL
jgi:Flp pilus assembly protein TadG